MSTRKTNRKLARDKIINAYSLNFWKECPNYPGYYASIEGGILLPTGRLCNAKPEKSGYIRIQVKSPEGERSRVPIHKMVVDAFLPPDATKNEIDHINRNPSDNRLSNLRRCTREENAANRVPPTTQKNRKRVSQYTPENIFIRTWDNITDAAKSIVSDISDTGSINRAIDTIRKCCLGRISYDKSGFIWCYYEEKLPDEEWRTIKVQTRDKDLVQIRISNKARIKRKNKIFTGYINKDGYISTGIHGSTFMMHNLVCRAFHGEAPEPNMTPDHIDRNPKNNDATNLRWATHSEQIRNRKLGTATGPKTAIIAIDKNHCKTFYESISLASRTIGLISMSGIDYCLKRNILNQKTGLRFCYATKEEIKTNTC